MDAEGVRLIARRGGREAERVDGGYLLRGEEEWAVVGAGAALEEIAAALNPFVARLGDVLLLSFGNAVGHFDAPALGRLEVYAGKWGRADFEQMLAELIDVAVGLPFATMGASLPYERGAALSPDVLYHAFVYLRHALARSQPPDRRLDAALRVVVHAPYHRFARDAREVALAEARWPEPAGLLRLASERGGLVPVGAAMRAQVPLAQLLDGHLPDRVLESRVEVTVDTAENRFVKAFLGFAGGVVEEMRRHVQQQPVPAAFARRVLEECDRMATLLRPIEQHGLWRQVGPMTHLPAASPVLQQRRGYREVYRHFARLRLATRLPLAPEVLANLLEAKDIAQLYELWCFFALARALEEVRAEPPVQAARLDYSATAVSLARGLEVRWADGTRLLYNPTFSRSGAAEWRSYSVPLRPDMALEVPDGPGVRRHLFDAKFRLERLAEVLPARESEGTDAAAGVQEGQGIDGATEAALDGEERRGSFKRGDLYKMHAYRDAIRDVRSVWILYPGGDFRFFNAHGGPVVLEADQLAASADGVGAIPLVPGLPGQSQIRSVMARLLEL